MSIPNIRIDLFENGIASVCTDFNKKNSIAKTVKIQDLIKCLNDSEISYQSPILPLNCIKYKEKGNNISIVIIQETCFMDITVYKEVYKNCRIPTVIMCFDLIKNGNSYTISNTRAFGIKDSLAILSDDTRLYGLPFPNVGSGGWVCWGGNYQGGSVVSLTSLTPYIKRFFNTPFNNHLFNTSLLSPRGIGSPEALFTYLQNKDTFPSELFEGLGYEDRIKNL